MTKAHLAIFDDHRGQWGPLTDLRAVFDLRTGMLTTLKRITLAVHQTSDVQPDALLVPAGLAAITREAHPGVAVNSLGSAADSQANWLLVHAGLSTPAAIAKLLTLAPGQALVDEQGRLAAANVSAAVASDWFHENQWHKLPQGIEATACDRVDVLQYPWDIQAHLDDTLRHDLLASDMPEFKNHSRYSASDIATEGHHPIKVHPAAKLHPMVVINAENGPVVIDDHAVVGSFAVIAGPCYIGQKTIIAPTAHIRASCSLGPSCVVGGEVSATVFQGYSNKSHAGYLGNSFVGQWVNLGADTNASNLKNTFGHVRMSLSPGDVAHDSNCLKLGPIFGDYVRTAIGSRLMTGSVIGTGAMLAISGFAPKFIERFAFLTDKSSDSYDIDKFVVTASYMMSWRDTPLTEAMENRLRQLAIKTTVV